MPRLCSHATSSNRSTGLCSLFSGFYSDLSRCCHSNDVASSVSHSGRRPSPLTGRTPGVPARKPEPIEKKSKERIRKCIHIFWRIRNWKRPVWFWVMRGVLVSVVTETNKSKIYFRQHIRISSWWSRATCLTQ